jgi:transposase
MQDDAPGHAAALTREELHEKVVYPIFWPAYSPNLNPIEAVWNKKKDQIESCSPDLPCGKQRTYEKFCEIVKGAWHHISPGVLEDLIDGMKD